jgi:Ca-activated chloride channel family protein
MKPVFVSALLPLLFIAPPQGTRTLVVTGTVTTAQGQPLQAAQVRIVARNVAVGTGVDGRYRILVPDAHVGKEETITVRSIGFRQQSRVVRLAGDTTEVNFVLEVDLNRLSETVVTGVADATATGKLAFTVDKVDQANLPVPETSALRQRAEANAPALGIQFRGGPVTPPVAHDPRFNTESYSRIVDNGFLGARDNPLSTFSIDVDRASYSNIRRFVSYGQRPPADAVRIEEMVNYFSYEYPNPVDRHPFSVTTEMAPAPWARGHYLLRVGLQARRLDPSQLPPSNLVFLVDVSGSMMPPNKLPLVKDAFRLLVRQLREDDHVAIVVYAGAAGLVLPPTSGDRKHEILSAIDRLQAGGSTAGGAGIRLAYSVARHHHIPRGNNRVILATDGDFNIGASSDAEMERLIEEQRKQGTFLSVLGFGTGNLKDSKMETLADKGNGNYAYIDNINEAKKVLVDEMAGTLLTLAKDVKIQVEFNPAFVSSYRLVGYENRLLAKEDFKDDTKDAGEIGAGHSVTALYEIVPVGARRRERPRDADDLRYQRQGDPSLRAYSDEVLHLKLRYKRPDEDRSRQLEHTVRASSIVDEASADFRFAASVAAFGMILRDSEYGGSATLDDVLTLARHALGEDPGGYREEFVRMVRDVRDRSLISDRRR